MTLYLPLQEKKKVKKYKRAGLYLGLLPILFTMTGLSWMILSEPISPQIAAMRLRNSNRELAASRTVTSPDPELVGPAIEKTKIDHRGEVKEFREVCGILEKGDTLYEYLLNKSIKMDTINTIVQELESIVPFSSARPGDTFALILDSEENLRRFEYNNGPIETYILERDPNGRLDSFKKEILLQKYWTVISGQIENSLFNAVIAVCEESALAHKFTDIFAWKIDFHNELRKGDKFRMIVEKYSFEDKFVKFGRILAAELNGYCGLHQAIFFEDEAGQKDYYDLKGVSVRRAFLRAPLSFNRISSGYSHHRQHPILGCVRPHLGIDYAAPIGTPVWSVADGIIVSARYEGGNGNQVIIKHMNGYQTYYNHLSRYGKGIRKGIRVKQKQVIGYVGTTGLSTGPHLDYRVKHHTKFINPLKADFPTGQKLAADHKKAFHQTAYNLLHFMYDNQKEKWICKVLYEDQKSLME